jgi:Cleaved Adhesin Domain
MKTFSTALFFFFAVGCSSLQGQSFTEPDTLLNEPFVEDNIPIMLSAPSGNDTDWVNYDADQITGACVELPDTTPFGWFLERDYSVPNTEPTSNDAFTSCSFLVNQLVPNNNWLITTPLFLPDSSYWLCWRSLSYYGPGFHDGYKVLVSKTSNDPADSTAFSKTLFKAAEMVKNSTPGGSLSVDDYVFSEGYIQANAYTDTSYFFVDFSEGAPFYHGKLEPHSVSLAEYSGETIYIAFLHDSQDDYQLQVDDILVSNLKTIATYAPRHILSFNVLPNPVKDAAYFFWKMKAPQEGRLVVTDNTGKVVKQQAFSRQEEGRLYWEMQDLAPGIYHCTLETAIGKATTTLVKI